MMLSIPSIALRERVQRSRTREGSPGKGVQGRESKEGSPGKGVQGREFKGKGKVK